MRPIALLLTGLSATTRAAADYLAALGAAQQQAFHDTVLAANETAPGEVILISPVMDLGVFANEQETNDRTSWVQLSPFGRFDNQQGMQIVDREAGKAIEENFANMKFWNSPGAALLGIPFYIGHPDHPNFKERYKDTKAYGRIKKIEVRDNGIFANVKWSREGAEMVREGLFHGQSAVWRMAPVPGKSREFRPIALQSVGFTNEPNIPVEPARLGANEKDTMTPEQLAALGLAKDATPEQIATAFASVIAAANEMKAAKEKLATAKIESVDAAIALVNTHVATIAANETKIGELTTANGTLTTEKATLTGQVTTLTTERNTAREAFANERKARNELIVAGGIKDGRITEADKPKYLELFANEGTFDTEVDKFNKLTPKVKTGGALDLGPRKGLTMSEAGNQLRAAAETIMANEKCSWDSAWQKAKAGNPQLVQAISAK